MSIRLTDQMVRIMCSIFVFMTSTYYIKKQYILKRMKIYFVILWTLWFFSGSRSGAIYHHDVRVANHHVSTLNNHSQEVCGLAWSPDGRYLASGGNDNLLNIWDATLSEEVSPLHTFSHHQAAVKVQMLHTFWSI